MAKRRERRLKRISGNLLGQMIESGKAQAAGKFEQTSPPPELWSRNRTRVRLQVQADRDLDRFSVLRAINMPITPADDIDQAMREPVFFGEVPTEDNRKQGPVAVIMEPWVVGSTELIEATIAGVTPVLNDSNVGDDPYLDTGDDIVTGVPSEGGEMKIIWPGTTSDPSVVLLGTDSSNGGGDTIRFKIEHDAAYGYGGGGEECDDKNEDAPTEARAKVLSRPCGVARVADEDDEGYVIVEDRLDPGFLAGREEGDIDGKEGIAVYVYDVAGSSYESCYWLIIWINWFEVHQIVTDVIIGESSICVEKGNAELWKFCELEKECIEGEPCPEEGGGGY